MEYAWCVSGSSVRRSWRESSGRQVQKTLVQGSYQPLPVQVVPQRQFRLQSLPGLLVECPPEAPVEELFCPFGTRTI